MRMLFLSVLFITFFAGCSTDDEPDCPRYWDIDKGQVSAYAKTDSGRLVFEVWNPVTPNAVELSQGPLIADFDVSITIDEMTWDTLVSPQFRLEVLDANNLNQLVSGVSVNPEAFYCYVGSTEPENRDMRVMHDPTGTLRISRIADTLICSADIGGVSLTYSDILNSSDLKVRLIFGSTNVSNSGNATVVLDDFVAFHNLLSSIIEDAGTQSDDFWCKSW